MNIFFFGVALKFCVWFLQKDELVLEELSDDRRKGGSEGNNNSSAKKAKKGVKVASQSKDEYSAADQPGKNNLFLIFNYV